MAGLDAELWKGALRKEIETLRRKGTFAYVVMLPPGRKALKGMFVFAVKVDGTYKARLVIKGCAQRLGQDYSQTFSPVSRSASMHLVVAVAVRDGLLLYAADFAAAFLNGVLQEEIYMATWSSLRAGRRHRNIEGLTSGWCVRSTDLGKPVASGTAACPRRL